MLYLVILPMGLFALVGMLLIRHRRQIAITLRDYFSATDDLWSWTTQDGRTFESVVPESTDGQAVIVAHRSGRARLLISELSEESRQNLFRSKLWLSRVPQESAQKKLKAA
jgi:hypothetical protein